MPDWMEKYTENNTAPGIVDQQDPKVVVVNGSSYYELEDLDEE